MPERPYDLTRIVLAVLFLGGLIGASFWILRPFLGALIWAVMIVIPTWPLLVTLQKRLGGQRRIAVGAMAIVLLAVLIVPLFAAIGTILSHADEIAGWAKHARELKLPPPPSWLAGLPIVGERAAQAWQQAAAQGIEVLAPYVGDMTRWFASKIGSIGELFVQFLLTVIVAGVLYAHGEAAAGWALRFGDRLAGQHGEAAIRLSAQAIRGVALGVVVTAILEALVGGAGLLIAGVPFAAVLTALVFLFAVAQIGGALVLVFPVIWLYWDGAAGWGTFLLLVTVATAGIDNVLRPVLIRKGADLPLLLIFAGVIGGLIAFGLIGIFVGPVVLAVGYTLLRAWLGTRPSGE